MGRGYAEGTATAARPRLRAGRCVVYVAAAGYGKTTALEALCADGRSEYHTATELVGRPTGAQHVVVDDLGELTVAAQRRLVQELAALPGEVHVSLAARRPLDRSVRAELLEPVVERGAADLALSRELLAKVLRDEHGIVDTDLCAVVHEVTAGWPALVHFAGEALGRHGVGPSELLPALTEPGTAGATWIRAEVLPDVSSDAAALLDAALELDPMSEALCVALASAGFLGAPARVAPLDTLHRLVRTGLLVTHPWASGTRQGTTLRLVPALAETLRQRRRSGGGPAGVRARLDAAVDWYTGNGHPLAAANLLSRAGQARRCVAVLEAHGDEILAAGRADDLLRLLHAVPDVERSTRLRLLLGDALRMSGDAAGAMRVFEPLLRAPAKDAGLLWRAAMVHYMRADYRAALDVCELAGPGLETTVDDALLLGCRASVLAMLGRRADASAVAADALRVADGVGDDRARAAAHVAAAFGSAGARRDEHLAAALDAAQRANDVVQLTRVLINQAVGLLREARYPQALQVAARAVRVAELGCPPGMFVTALSNAGEALLRLGKYDEAALHFERVVQVSHKAGLQRAAIGLCGVAEVYRQLGRREQSRTAFEEAVELIRATGDPQELVAALVGLTRVLLEGPAADLEAARAAADEAESVASAPVASLTMVARGWVAFAEGDLAMAQQRAAAAIAAARSSRRADCLAEALEFVAAVSTDPADAAAALRESEAIWRGAGALPAADRALVLLGRLPGAAGAQRSAAKSAARRLMDLGVRAIDGSQLLPDQGTSTPVRIRVLGGFEVFVGGRPVPLPAWRSRQARSLVKILVARRGRPVARLELRELLWPDEEPHRTAHRLSVLLSVVRTVLDPSHLWPADHHVRADLAGISLDVDHVAVDVEELMRDAAHATELIRDGAVEHAREVLAEVDSLYRGDAFSDEPYEEWADGLREEARAVWLRALRDLADLGRAGADPDQAVACLVRVLGVDAYDESAHRMIVEVLVRAGRHGEARRAFERWCQAMRSIDAPPPAAEVLSLRTGSPGRHT